jgi:hypothetical protein
VRAIVLTLLAAVAASSCGGQSPAPPSSDQSPVPRLAWSQSAPTEAIFARYSFILFVDGARTALTTVSCQGPAPTYQCSMPLPQMSAGRHALELATLDAGTGLESDRSTSLPFDAPSTPRDEHGRPVVVSRTEVTVDVPSTIPSMTCAAEGPSTCFGVSRVADDVGPVERIVPLPDGRLLLLYPGAIARILPDGLPQRLDVSRPGETAAIADAVADRDFITTRLMFFATTASTADGRGRVSIVRMREVGDRLGEAATIATDLDAAQGPAALSLGPDRQLYVALPSDGTRSPAGLYDGLVLRLTRDGMTAGYNGMSSPVVGAGSSRPTSFAWVDGSHLLLASDDLTPAASLGLVPFQRFGTAPPQMLPLPMPNQPRLGGGIRQLAVGVAVGVAAGHVPATTSLFMLGATPPSLYVASLAVGLQPALVTVNALPLGTTMPTALAVAGNGDVMVAARDSAGTRIDLLRLSAR